MAQPTIEEELLSLEKKYWQAIQDKDTAIVAELSDEPCIVAGASGVAQISRDAMKAMFERATWSLNRFELGKDAQVRMLGDDVAILAYRVHEELTVEGKPLALDASDASTWVRRDGKWVCALHTEALLGDSFGRDRLKKN